MSRPRRPRLKIEALTAVLAAIIKQSPGALDAADRRLACIYIAYSLEGQSYDDGPAAWYAKAARDIGPEEIADLLLLRGARIDADSRARAIALHWATSAGHLAMVRKLLDDGADVNDANGTLKLTPLRNAAAAGDEPLVKLLLSRGAEVNARDMTGFTPLFLASGAGHGAVVRLLVESGADANASREDDFSPLHAAARGGHQDVVRLLLDAGADLRSRTKGGRTPLDDAASEGHSDVVSLVTRWATASGAPRPRAPAATIAVHPMAGEVPFRAHFEGPADPDQSLILHQWDFGDGSSGIGSQVEHHFLSAGTFTVRLTVTDYAGQAATGTVTVTSTARRPDKIAVVVDADLKPSINTRLERYIADLKASGCAVQVCEWRTGVEDEPALLKQRLMDIPGLTGAVLIGSIAPALYEFDEGLEGQHTGFPCDLYYMDFAADWSDADGDSYFDTITGEPYPEIWVSRLYAANIDDVFPDRSEADLINRYFDKNHAFRTGALRLPDRALAYQSYDFVRGGWSDSGLSPVYRDVRVANDGRTTRADDMMRRRRDGYEHVWLTAHGDPGCYVFMVGHGAAGSIPRSDVVAGDPRVLQSSPVHSSGELHRQLPHLRAHLRPLRRRQHEVGRHAGGFRPVLCPRRPGEVHGRGPPSLVRNP